MQTKNIFKTLALVMLMPTMLLTTACSSEDDVVNSNTANIETVANKGYALPVTVNVTREGDATMRATYNTTDRKLEFSTGDKLFVKGNDYSAGGAGFFAGTLTWQSGGTFSGTILTQNEYSGTIDALFTAPSTLATLIPANYVNYSYFSFTNEGTYEASVTPNYTKTIASSKATAVEQFSNEVGGYTSGTGFALKPANAILNFTITGLAADTGVNVALSEKGVDFTISGGVPTDDSGTATFAIGVKDETDLNELTLKVGGKSITLVSSSKKVAAGKIYNINRAAFTMAADATSADKGKLICTDGHIHANGADTGCTKARVAKIVYVGSETAEAANGFNHGLALALSDASTSCQWSTETGSTVHTYNATSSSFASESGLQYNDATHNSDTYPAFKAAITYSPAAPTGCSAWFLASGYQWQKMADAVGGYDKLGLSDAVYWSSTEQSAVYAWWLYSKDGIWSPFNKDAGKEDPYKDYHVRACLAF